MPIRDHLDHLTQDPGLLAIVVADGQCINHRGDDDLIRLANAVTDLARLSGEPMTRVLVGHLSITAYQFGSERVTVVHRIGDGVAKSIRRSLERAHLRGPQTAPRRANRFRGKVRPTPPPPPRTPTSEEALAAIEAMKRTVRLRTSPAANGSWLTIHPRKPSKRSTSWETEGLPSVPTRPW